MKKSKENKYRKQIKKDKNKDYSNLFNDVVAVLLMGMSAFILVSLIKYHRMGIVGKYIYSGLVGPFGGAALLIPLILIIVGIEKLRGKTRGGIINLVGGIFVLISASAFLSLIHITHIDGSLNSGGSIGMVIAAMLNQYAKFGSYIITLTVLAIGFILLTEVSLISIGKFVGMVLTTITNGIYQKIFSPEKERKPTSINLQKIENFVTQKPKIFLSQQAGDGKNAAYLEDKSKGKEHGVVSISSTSYQLPPLSLLNDSMPPSQKQLKEDLLANAGLIQETLRDFGVEATVIEVSRGPVVTRFEVQPAAGVKVSSITSLSDDLALALAAPSVRIETPIPGKQALGIELPNRQVTMVYIKELLGSEEFKKEEGVVAIGIGKDISGVTIIGNLDKMPHLLIAGATGSGKSVCINTIVTGLLFRSYPDEVKFLMIDPKIVELSIFNGIPHLLLPVVTDPKKAVLSLNWVIREMESRYRVFAQEGVRDIHSYNQKAKKLQKVRPIPYIVVVIDELADLMMISSRACEDAITRLSQMARAVGIHLILATQRPSVDVITGVIKANFPSRIAFQVFSRTDSRTILDMIGAEKLLGRGDMLYLPTGTSKPLRVQGSYISNEEIERVVNFIKNQQIVDTNPELSVQIDDVFKEDDLDIEDEELFEKSLKIVVKCGYASTSMLQRKFKIGYNRAARLVDMMEERGYVGPSDGSRPREVLVTLDEI